MNIQKFTSLKKILFVALLCIGTSHSFAQNSNGIFFQAVARDNFSNPAKDRNIYVQSTIIQNTTTGTKVLIETHKSSTDAMGVFNITIGNGQRTGGTATSITAIDWSKGPFYLNLKIAITPFSASDNWDYTKELIDMGTTSFGAVPFAFYSASSAKVDDKLNATDTTKMLAVYAKAMSVKTLETSLATKLTAADTLTMLAPYAKAAYTIDSSFFKTQLATKLSIADSSKYVTSSQLASYNFSGGGGTTIDTTSLSNRINLKANTADVASAIAASTSSINTNTTAITAEAVTARAAELALSNSIANNTSNIATNTTAIANLNSLNTNIASNTASITSLTSFVLGQVATSSASELTITNNLTANTALINSLNTNVASNTASITSNTTSINNLNTNVVSNLSSINSLNTTIAAATNSNTVNTIVKRDASGNFSAGTINATSVISPIYASAPQPLTDATTISWNPANGLNASVTLAGNRTLSFTSTPVAGSYGTLVVTQDATGGRTITLPSTTNKVLGSTSGTTIALSTIANAKDILNFYYDGTNCYWNIGQGYGAAATAPFTLTTTGTGAATLSGTTLNIPVASATVNAGSISGTIAVANGGTGASTQQASINALTGIQSSGKYLRSDGTNATLTNIEAADIPTLNQNTTGNAATATLATNATTAGNITATSNGTLTSLSNLNTVGTITGGTISVTTDIKTSGTLTTGSVSYPKTHGTSGQVLSTTGSGTLTWTTASAGGGSTAHTVGEVYGGGIVFYITTGGLHGMIASSTNIGGTPHEFIDRVSSPSYHSTTTNDENLYVDWVAPTYTQLLLLYNARNTAGLNLGTSKYHSSTNDPNDAFGYKFINFSNGTSGTVNGNWTDVNNGRGIRFF